MGTTNIAVIQMKVSNEKEKNIKKAEEMIKNAIGNIESDRGIDLVILPEMFNCPYETELFPKYAETKDGYTCEQLARIAEENNIYLLGGSIPEKSDNNIYNTSYLFSNKGKKIAKHRKIHLFDIDIKGGQKFRESDTLTAGSEITVIDTPFAKLGLLICYDIRFPELARLLVDRGAEIILVPGAFNMTTGPAHWETLFRTRALDNQVFMIGAAPACNEDSSYLSYGNSIIVDPWGRVLNRLGEGEGLLIETLNMGLLTKIREELPLLKHRRRDLYSISEKKL